MTSFDWGLVSLTVFDTVASIYSLSVDEIAMANKRTKVLAKKEICLNGCASNQTSALLNDKSSLGTGCVVDRDYYNTLPPQLWLEAARSGAACVSGTCTRSGQTNEIWARLTPAEIAQYQGARAELIAISKLNKTDPNAAKNALDAIGTHFAKTNTVP